MVTASIRAWSSEGGSLSVQARHHRVRVVAGVSQERMARKALGLMPERQELSAQSVRQRREPVLGDILLDPDLVCAIELTAPG
ncbi:hypothetical protein SMF913_25152 [Streptomyces malaysiensis]|uniref:Uncharacterized protein n=1 Tax=Streptomyces malaysiensis TaxID=92644 RepID=A0A2J7YNT7_STRMQ|nr:hypothetical protein SMF913_25152 [Streptomyces malaysiensis]